MTKNFTQNRMKKLSALVSGSKLRAAAFVMALMLSSSLFAQTLVNVLPNTNATSGNGRAPQGTRLFINTTYIILPSEMTTSGYGADNITSVGWTWNNPLGAGAPTTQSIATTGTLKIWMQSTTDVIYSKGTTFSTAGMTKVYDGTITIPATAAQINLDLPVGGPGTSVFTTVAGEGVYVAFEYQTTTTLATPIGAPTVSCNAAVTGSAATYQSQTVNGTAMTLTAFRPETRFGTVNSDIVQVQNLYCLGTTAALFGNPQPLQAIVKNVSAVSQSFNVDFTIMEKATLTVRHSSSIPVVLGAGLTATVDDLGWNATLTELDTAIVSVSPMPGETILGNNEKGYRHNVTADSYNYSDLSASTGGVGYGLGEGLILNRYHIDGCSNVPQVRVYMGDANSAFNIVYAVVLDAAGTIVGQSADYTIMPGDIGTYVTFDIITPPNFTDADVYVGLAQTLSIIAYYPVGTQAEPFPARSNAYYATGILGGLPAMYTTLGRFMIEGVITPLSTTPTTSGDVTICLGESTDISVTDGILNPYATYNWYTDGCGTTFVGTGSSISVSPGSTTTYYVRAEDPCNGVNTSCGSLTVTVEIPTLWYADADGDTYGDAGVSSLACDAPVGYVADATDCNDGNSAVNPGATEVCNAIDDDCEGGIDEGLVFSTWYADGDGDTYGDAGTSVSTCDGAPGGYVADATDCNDESAAVNPGATEICNTIDDNCDGNTDEGLISAAITTPEPATFCNGGSIMLNAATDPSYSYQWYRNGLPIPGAIASSYNATFAGNYAIMISVAPSCAELSEELTVTKIASPAAAITNMDATNDLCFDASIKLKANGGGGLTYQWYKGPTLLVGATSNVYYATTPGGYKVITTYTATGCSKLSATYSIIQTCREDESSMEESMSVYPNPTSGGFTLDLNLGVDNAETAYINVYNLVGDVVYTTTASVNNGAVEEFINLEVAGGVYLVKVTTDGSDREYNTKVVLTK